MKRHVRIGSSETRTQKAGYRGLWFRVPVLLASLVLATGTLAAGGLALTSLSGSAVAGADTPGYTLNCNLSGTNIPITGTVTTGDLPVSVEPSAAFSLTNYTMKMTMPDTAPFSSAAGLTISGTYTTNLAATGATPASQSVTFTIPSTTFPNPFPANGVSMTLTAPNQSLTAQSSVGTAQLSTTDSGTLAIGIGGAPPSIDLDCTNPTNLIAETQVGTPPPPSPTLYVAQGGTDVGACTSQATPCATLSYADNQASNGDTIDVAGTISDNATIDKSLTITGANASPNAPPIITGAVGGDPAITVGANNVTISDLTVENSTGGNYGEAGGIEAEGSVTLDNDTITGNSSPGGYGGGVQNLGGIVIENSTISNNSADQSGGFYNDGGTATIIDSTISGNTGGASANYGGGGITNSGFMSLTDSTVADNTATGSGGGILDSGALVLTSDTIDGNNATAGGGVATTSTATSLVGGTIIAGNTGVFLTHANCTGPALTSVGYNLTDDSTGSDCGFTQPTDVVDADPQLGALADNGGPTQTMLPAGTSLAVAQIPLNTTISGRQVCPGTDQRGTARPQPADGTACTIGSVEVAPSGTAPSITSANATTFAVGTAGSFQVTATGQPDPTFSEQGSLPSGVSLSSSGLLSGTPASGTAGSYPITITATNGVSPDATQAFTLTVSGATPPATKSTLEPGQSLTSNQQLTVPSGKYRLVMQSDGNLVEYQGSKALWNAGTDNHPGAGVVMQKDGNLVIYSKGKAIWSSKTSGNSGAYLTLQSSDGNVVIYTPAHKAIWNTGT